MNQLGGKKARKVESESIDLLKSYSWALRGIGSDVRDKVLQEMKQLALKTLQGMFSLVVGEYIFDPSKFRGELTLQIPADELVVTGVKNWLDKTLIYRKLFEKQFRIKLNPDYRKLLASIKIPSSDTFLIFRIEDSIHFQELHPSSGITEDECLKLIYLYKCFGLVEVNQEQFKGVQKPKVVPQPQAKLVPQVKPVAPASKPVPPPVSPAAPISKPATASPVKEEPPSIGFQGQTSKGSAPQDEKQYFAYYKKCAEDSFRAKNYWAAVEHCKKALEIKKDASMLNLMGNAFATHPKFRAEAMDSYKKAMQLDPGNPAILRDMGDLYFATGSLKLARSRYEDALKLDPNDEHSKMRLVEIAKTF
jgi:tetratricopeptide (TPR) repeat protein